MKAGYRGLSTLLVLTLLMPLGAEARRKSHSRHPKRSVATSPTEADTDDEDKEDVVLRPRPLDVIQPEIAKKHKNKSVRNLKRAYEALRAAKYPEAIRLATPSQRDPVFSDYGYWIAATAQYGAGQKALEAKRYAEAIKAGERVLSLELQIESKSVYSPMLKNVPRDMGLAEVLMGDAEVGTKKWLAAENAFERGFQRLSSSGTLGLVRPDSLQNYAKACSAKKTELCTSWIQRFSVYYPKNSEEMRAVIKVFPSAGDRPRAAYTGKITQSYKAPDLDQTAFEQGMALYLDGKFGGAIRALRQFGDEFPKSVYRFRARYWLAQALTHEQDHEKAQKTYEELQHDSPLTYYGLLAAFASGKPMDAPITPTIPFAIERDPLLLPQETVRLQRAENFLAEGASDLAALELKDLKARDALSSPFLMYLAALNAEAHTYTTAFTLMSDLVARNYDGATSLSFLGMVFPIAHFDTIKLNASLYGLDPILVLSLVKQESAFDMTAISSSGALGLMQLMPATATDTEPSVQRASLVEAETNVRVGAKYLSHLIRRFNGNIALALAGYNAGPNAVDRWYKESGGKRSMLEFIETIPYKETREYVASIIRNYYWYSRKLTPLEPTKALTYFWGVQGAAPSPVPSQTPSPAPTPSVEPSAEPSVAPSAVPEDSAT